MRSTLSTFTKHTMGRVRRRTSTKQRSGVTLGPAGNIFGAAAYYGTDSYGTVIELAKQKSGYQETTLQGFTGSDGGYPYGNIMVDAKGNLYGTTFRGGNLSCNTVQQGCGVVFEMKP